MAGKRKTTPLKEVSSPASSEGFRRLTRSALKRAKQEEEEGDVDTTACVAAAVEAQVNNAKTTAFLGVAEQVNNGKTMASEASEEQQQQKKVKKTKTAARRGKQEVVEIVETNGFVEDEEQDQQQQVKKAKKAAQKEVKSAAGPALEACSVKNEEEVAVTEEKKTGKAKSVTAANRKSETTSLDGVGAKKDEGDEPEPRFVGEPVDLEEAKKKWPHRYAGKRRGQAGSQIFKGKDDNEEIVQARHHYLLAEVDFILYSLDEDALVQAEEGQDPFICKITEFFESIDGEPYFAAQWYYRAKDTVIKDHASLIDDKRVFFSEVKDDNPLDCLIKKINIAKVDLYNKRSIPECDFYCDMMYLLPYSSFVKLPQFAEGGMTPSEGSTISSDVNMYEANAETKCDFGEVTQGANQPKSEVKLLDLYAGCGAMSTGLCLGANLSNLNLVTRWAVDINKYACESLRLNHPETEVRNESAEDLLMLLKEWEMLCVSFGLVKGNNPHPFEFDDDDEEEDDEGNNENDGEEDDEAFEVDHIVLMCYGDPKESGERGLWFKVHWKGYDESYDSWEPLEGLRNCKKSIQAFVAQEFRRNALPLPGDVDVICGGPPCQGISGFNRFRDKENPLRDEKNKQLVVFMDIVDYLKPKFVLMENVVDLVRFAGGFLGRYALGRLVGSDYQARMGLLVAGAYGLPQFRMRVFVWGARPSEILPPYPLPTHDVVVRGNIPTEFEPNAVAYEEGHNAKLEEKLLLGDAISDLPEVGTYEKRDEMPYDKPPKTEFQRFIRLTKEELLGASLETKGSNQMLYDHRPLELNEDDYGRVCQIPKKKGANFRDLKGVIVGPDNKVAFDPQIERVYLKSGKPLVPDYAMSFIRGTSSKPFGRLWWDETVPTVVGRAEPHNQIILHPEQDRVLTIRENARLQGFPDFYKLCGPIKERYVQIGNAVAVPVARALGYALAQAVQGMAREEPLSQLPPKFPNILQRLSSSSSEDVA